MAIIRYKPQPPGLCPECCGSLSLQKELSWESPDEPSRKLAAETRKSFILKYTLKKIRLLAKPKMADHVRFTKQNNEKYHRVRQGWIHPAPRNGHWNSLELFHSDLGKNQGRRTDVGRVCLVGCSWRENRPASQGWRPRSRVRTTGVQALRSRAR